MTYRYRIKKIILQNITTHENTQLALPGSGSLALVGPNGAGKSSIIEAVYAALTLKTLRGRDYDIVSRGKRSGVIKLLMEADGDLLEATVKYDVSDRRRSKIVALKRNGRLVASTIKDYTSRIAEILGIRNIQDYSDLVKSTTIIPQGGLRSIADKMSRPSEFRKLIEAAIGLPDYRKAVEQLSGFTVSYRDPIYSYTIPRISSKDLKKIAQSKRYRDLNRILEELKDKVDSNRERLEKARILVEALEKELDEVKKRIDNVQVEIREREKKIALLEARIRELREKERELEELRKEYGELVERLEEALRAEERLEELKRMVELQNSINQYYRIAAERVRLEARLSEVKSIIDDAAIIEATLAAAREYESLEERIRELMERQLELAKNRSTIKEKIKHMDSLARRIEDLIRQAAERLGIEIPTSIDSGLEALKRAHGSIALKLEEARKRLDELSREEALLKSKLEEAEKALEAILKATEPVCPVCGRPLDESHKARIVGELRDRITQGRERLRELEAEVHGLEREASNLESIVGEVESIISLIEELAKGFNPEVYAELLRELEEVERELEEIQVEIEAGRRRLREVEASWKRYHGALERLSRRGIGLESIGKYREEYRRLREEYERLRKAEEGLKKEVLASTNSSSIEEAKVKIARAVEELPRLSRLAGQANVLRERIEELRERIDAISREVADIRGLERELEDAVEELEGLKRLKDELEEKRDGVVDDIGRARRDMEDASREIERLRVEIESWSEVKKRVVTAAVAGTILLDVQERLLENARLSIEESMTDILEKFGLEYHAVDIRDVGNGFEVTALSRRGGQPMPVSALSGGEQTALALAYVMALQRTLALRIGFLILDEPTSELDSERRETLMELIGRVSSEGVAEQLIVVTHHEDVIDKVDQVCRVSKPMGVSRVNCEED